MFSCLMACQALSTIPFLFLPVPPSLSDQHNVLFPLFFFFGIFPLFGQGGGWAQGLGIRLFAFGGAYWPLTTAHSDPLWARMCFGCVSGAPG